ncbi:hypothetical protein EV421DRAFT_1744213 [Armillaria borealis]|uniref:Uncharacterized protein n=1 Tax=Armillaria borealis TaxID=47425 RepID=A0AA39IUW0_9AGAR|nr:hypothetical protein EV421DRAFT_1744213 [Armillaria borealis]
MPGSDLPQELIDKILGMAFISSAVARACSIYGRGDWNTVTKPYHSILSEVLNNIRACALKGAVALEVVDCDIEGCGILSTVDGRALPMHSIRTFIYSTEDSSLKLLNSRLFRAYLACSLVSATSVLIWYDDECRRSAVDVVEYTQSTLKDLLIISHDPSQQELLDIRLDEYPVLRQLGVNISNKKLYRLAEYLQQVPKSYVGELQVLVATNFTNRYWGDWTRLDRTIIDRARFPGLRLLSLRFLWREPIKEDLEWFFANLVRIEFGINHRMMDVNAYLVQESIRESLMWRRVGSVDCIVHMPDDHFTVAATSKWFNRLSGLGDYNERFHVKHYYVTSSSRDSFVTKLEGIQILVLSSDLAKTMASMKLGSVV